MSSDSPAPHGAPVDSGLETLLEPSLDPAAAPAQPLFSGQAMVLVAFFGGVYAAVVFCAANALRMGKVKADGWILALVALAWTAVLWWALQQALAGTAPEWLSVLGNTGRTVRFGGKLLAMGVVGLVYLRRRPMFMGQALAGVEPASPWTLGLISVLVAMGISSGIAILAGAGQVFRG